MENTE
jgi:hypothetical protein